jgi:cell pole-organizing protein PopZ
MSIFQSILQSHQEEQQAASHAAQRAAEERKRAQAEFVIQFDAMVKSIINPAFHKFASAVAEFGHEAQVYEDDTSTDRIVYITFLPHTVPTSRPLDFKVVSDEMRRCLTITSSTKSHTNYPMASAISLQDLTEAKLENFLGQWLKQLLGMK